LLWVFAAGDEAAIGRFFGKDFDLHGATRQNERQVLRHIYLFEAESLG
jgi:hypothetical protein